MRQSPRDGYSRKPPIAWPAPGFSVLSASSRVPHISQRCGCAAPESNYRSGRTIAPYHGNSVPLFHRDPIDTARIIKEQPNSALVVCRPAGPDLEPVASSAAAWETNQCIHTPNVRARLWTYPTLDISEPNQLHISVRIKVLSHEYFGIKCGERGVPHRGLTDRGHPSGHRVSGLWGGSMAQKMYEVQA